jgi:hypothetical protein
MTDPAPKRRSTLAENPPSSRRDPRSQDSWLDWTVPLGASIALTTTARVAAGPSLGAIIAGQWAMVILIPPLVTAAASLRRQLIASVAAIAGVLFVWWITLERVNFPAGPMCGVSLCTIAWGLELALLSVAARNSAIGLAAPGCVSLSAVAFFTWPVWLAAHLSSAAASRLASIHPALVADGVLNLPVWFEQPIAYRELTVLNQSIPCSLPTGWLTCATVHGAIAAGLLIAAMVRSRIVSEPKPPSPTAASRAK